MVEDFIARSDIFRFRKSPDHVGHLDVIKRWNAVSPSFTEQEVWYFESVKAAFRGHHSIGCRGRVEYCGLARGFSVRISVHVSLKRCRDLNIPRSADSHTPAEVAWGFERAASLLGLRWVFRQCGPFREVGARRAICASRGPVT